MQRTNAFKGIKRLRRHEMVIKARSNRAGGEGSGPPVNAHVVQGTDAYTCWHRHCGEEIPCPVPFPRLYLVLGKATCTRTKNSIKIPLFPRHLPSQQSLSLGNTPGVHDVVEFFSCLVHSLRKKKNPNPVFECIYLEWMNLLAWLYL